MSFPTHPPPALKHPWALYFPSPFVTPSGMLDKLRQMQRSEADPQVLANCLTVLMQVSVTVRSVSITDAGVPLLFIFDVHSLWDVPMRVSPELVSLGGCT